MAVVWSIPTGLVPSQRPGGGRTSWSWSDRVSTLEGAPGDGDGAAELVLADPAGLHVLAGRDGSVVGELPVGSCSNAHAYPVVADVDGDGKAEIVMGSYPCTGSPAAGLRAFGEARDGWVRSRASWNQYDHSVPGENGWRANAPAPGASPFASPDLTASSVRRSDSDSGSDIVLTARIGDAGMGTVNAGVPVSVYNGDPRLGYPHLASTVTTRPLAPGEYEDVVLRIPSDRAAQAALVVAADDAGDQLGTISECDEENNLHDTGLFLNQPPSFPVAGTYLLGIDVSDSRLTIRDFVEVTVYPANAAPVVSAGPDTIVTLPATSVSLAGSVSNDGKPQGASVSSTWSVVSGPAGVAFANAASPSTAVTFAEPGSYRLRLTASDGDLTASDDVEIVANPGNEPPRVNAGLDGSVTTAVLTLAGQVSDDGLPGGSLTAVWSVVSGPGAASFTTAASPTTAARFEADGAFTLRLTATDGELVASDDVTFMVARVNQPPAVEAGASQAVTLPAISVTLRGSASDDGLPAETPLAYRWTLDSGPGTVGFGDSRGATTTASFDAPGTYVLRLTASDGALSGSDMLTVAVNPGAPTGAAPSLSIAAPLGGARISQATDVVGTVTSNDLFVRKLDHRLRGEGSWTGFATGDTTAANAVLGQLDPSLLLNGLHEIRLSATDNGGRTTRATTIVVVRENLKVGHFTVSFVDMEVPVAGQPIRVTRTYDSRDKRKGDFGHGWRLDVSNVRVQTAATLGLSWQGTVSASAFASYCLQPTVPPVVTLTFPDGRVQESRCASHRPARRSYRSTPRG